MIEKKSRGVFEWKQIKHLRIPELQSDELWIKHACSKVGYKVYDENIEKEQQPIVVWKISSLWERLIGLSF